MNLIDAIANFSGDLFTDRRLFSRRAKYVRKNGHEIAIDATSYKSDENSRVFAGASLDVKMKEFLVKADDLRVRGVRFFPAQDDKIFVGEAAFRVMNGESKKPYRYLDATETMMVIQTQRFGRNASN